MKKSDIQDKIKKLQALANSTTFDGERANAQKMAEDLQEQLKDYPDIEMPKMASPLTP